MTFFKSKIFRILLVLASPLFFISQVSAIEVPFHSLRGYIETKNERVLAKKKKYEAAHAQKGSLRRSFLPKVSVGAGVEAFQLGSRVSETQPFAGAEASVNLYNGGRDQFKKELYQLSREKTVSQIRITVAEELADARETYWKIVFLKSELRLITKMIGLNQKNLLSANRRIRAGLATPSDRLEFEMKLLDLKRDKKINESEIKSLSYELLAAIGQNVSEPLILSDSLEHNNEWEQELAHSHDSHDFLTRPAEILAQELKLKKKMKKRSWAPKLDAYVGWYQRNQRKEDDQALASERQESVAGFRLSMDLSKIYSEKSDVASLNAQTQSAKLSSIYLHRKNEAHVEKEFLELRTLYDQVHDAEKHIDMSQKYYRATLSEYARGAKNSPDVLGAAERLEQVTRKKNELLRDFHIARSHALTKMGK